VYKTFKLDINYKKVDKKTWLRNVENIWELLIKFMNLKLVNARVLIG